MLFALVHLVLRRVFSFASGSESQSQSKDVEILVLRCQLKVWGAFNWITRFTCPFGPSMVQCLGWPDGPLRVPDALARGLLGART